MHTCPECFSACHCRGDIDDIDLGDDTYCEHYLSPACTYNDPDDDYDPSEDERLDDPRHGQATEINKRIR